MGDVLSIDARDSRVGDLHVAPDAKALGENASVQHDEMVVPEQAAVFVPSQDQVHRHARVPGGIQVGK
jgi:hypothetical protein